MNHYPTSTYVIFFLVTFAFVSLTFGDTDSSRVSELVRQLGDDDYYVRQFAQDELLKIGSAAFDEVRAAAT
ncbi:MAG: hypothetical protein LBU65_15740, partial [Planctomycetaceae bacterium]|nr:hypothetical protein [Planctomycetaceae bacterium]